MSDATMAEDAPLLITVAEAARLLAVSPDTVRALIKSGAIDHCRPSPGTVRVVAASLHSHVERMTVRGGYSADLSGLTHVRLRPRRPRPSRP